MRSEDEVNQIMRNKYDLIDNEDYWRVYINNDLSKAERETEYNERKNRRSRQFSNAARGAGMYGGGGNAAWGTGAAGGARSAHRTTGAGVGRGSTNAAIGTAQTTVPQNSSNNMQLPKPVTEEMGIERMAPLTHGELLGQMAKSTAAASASVSDVVSTGATSTAAAGAGNGLSQAVGNNTAVNVRNEVSTGADTDPSQAVDNTADSPVRQKM